jgi:hypothetical protein
MDAFSEGSWVACRVFTQALQKLGANVTREGLVKALNSGVYGTGGMAPDLNCVRRDRGSARCEPPRDVHHLQLQQAMADRAGLHLSLMGEILTRITLNRWPSAVERSQGI